MFNKFIFFLAVSYFFLFGISKVFASNKNFTQLMREHLHRIREDAVPTLAHILSSKYSPCCLSRLFIDDPYFEKNQGNGPRVQHALYLKMHRDLLFLIQERGAPIANPTEEQKEKLLKKFSFLYATHYTPGEDPRFLYTESDEDEDCYNPPKGKRKFFLRGNKASLVRRVFVHDSSAPGHQAQEGEEEQQEERREESAPSNATQARLRKKLQQRQQQVQAGQQPKEEEQGAVGGVTQAAPSTWSDFEEEKEKEGKKKKKKKKNKKDKLGDDQKGEEKKDKDLNESSDSDGGKGGDKPVALVKVELGVRPKEKSVQPPPLQDQGTKKKKKKKKHQQEQHEHQQHGAQRPGPSEDTDVKLSIQEVGFSIDDLDLYTDPFEGQDVPQEEEEEQAPLPPPAPLVLGPGEKYSIQEEGTGEEHKEEKPEEDPAPEPSEAGLGAVGGARPYKADLLGVFNHQGQHDSLQKMQHIFLGSSEHVLSTLKHLVLKKKNFYSTTSAMNALDTQDFPLLKDLGTLMPYQCFVSTDKHRKNLEEKTQSGQAGIDIQLFSGKTGSFHKFLLSLAYDFNTNMYNEFSRGQLLTEDNSIVKAKLATNGLIAMLAHNPDEQGLTCNVGFYYSHGKAKNIRHIRHGQSQTVTRGDSNVVLIGRLLQVGYNLSLVKSLTITPYIETIMSNIQSGAYKEQKALYACSISKNRNDVLENSIGVRLAYQTTEHIQLQTALYSVFGKQKIRKITSKTILEPGFEVSSWSDGYHNKYTHTKLDIAYEMLLTSQLHAGLNSSIQFGASKKQDKQFLNIYFGYIY